MSNSVNSKNQNYTYMDSFCRYAKTTASGAASAAFAVLFFMPMMAAKNAMQSRAKLSSPTPSNSMSLFQRIRKMYVGGGGFAASFAPTIALQTLVTDWLSSYIHPAFAAAGGGAFSTVIVSPTELLINQKQLNGKSFRTNFNQLSFSNLFRGAGETAFREGFFTLGYAYFSPLLKREFKEWGMNDLFATILAGLGGAVPMAVCTQTVDTVKTRKQRDLLLKTNFREYFKLKSFAGLNWRMMMVFTAISAISTSQEFFNKFI